MGKKKRPQPQSHTYVTVPSIRVTNGHVSSVNIICSVHTMCATHERKAYKIDICMCIAYVWLLSAHVRSSTHMSARPIASFMERIRMCMYACALLCYDISMHSFTKRLLTSHSRLFWKIHFLCFLASAFLILLNLFLFVCFSSNSLFLT